VMMLVVTFSCYFMSPGLSDEMRSDFHLMKDLATHTRVGPQERSDTLAKFMSDMKRYSHTDNKNILLGLLSF
jgi:hypothetical protein